MIAIITRTRPATDTLPTRIVAIFCDRGWGGKRLTVPYDYERNADVNHAGAAGALYHLHGVRKARLVGSADLPRAARVHLFDPSL
jgi:hypothetical protein